MTGPQIDNRISFGNIMVAELVHRAAGAGTFVGPIELQDNSPE